MDNTEAAELQRQIQESRITKAKALALMLRRAGGTFASASKLDRKARRLTAALAGTREPSELTWGLVLAMLEVAETPLSEK